MDFTKNEMEDIINILLGTREGSLQGIETMCEDCTHKELCESCMIAHYLKRQAQKEERDAIFARPDLFPWVKEPGINIVEFHMAEGYVVDNKGIAHVVITSPTSWMWQFDGLPADEIDREIRDFLSHAWYG